MPECHTMLSAKGCIMLHRTLPFHIDNHFLYLFRVYLPKGSCCPKRFGNIIVFMIVSIFASTLCYTILVVNKYIYLSNSCMMLYSTTLFRLSFRF